VTVTWRVMLAGAALALVACGRAPGQAPRAAAAPPESPPADVREDAVHLAALEDALTSPRADGRGPVYVAAGAGGLFESEAAALAWADGPQRSRRPAPASALRAFALANMQAGRVRLPPAVRRRAVVVVDSSVHQLNGGGRSPRWVYVLSRVGFSTAGDTAVVLRQHTCGALCGSTALLLMVRGPAGWTRGDVLESYIH
jgi:hypothetical protein